jgi:hypothetical protein
MGTIANNDNLYGPYKWIVNPISGKGTHTTIQAAVTASSSGDIIFITPGTYTENISLTTSRKFIGSDNTQADTIILGKISDGGNSISPFFQNLTLKTNGDYFLNLTGASSFPSLVNCYLNCVNFTGITGTSGTGINLFECTGDTGTTGIGIYSGAIGVSMTKSSFTNSGATVTASTTSANATFNFCNFTQPFSCSSTGVVIFRYSNIDTSLQNATAFTTAGSGTSSIFYSEFTSGSASAISIGASTVVQAIKCVINSTNTNPVTGSGTYKSDDTTYSNTGILPNPTTETFAIVGRKGTFTPVLQFGGGSTGITYTTQLGTFTRIGNVVTFQTNITLSAKGSSTGAAAITGLPYASAGITACVISASLLTFTGQVVAVIGTGGTQLNLRSFATTLAFSDLLDTAFVNTTVIQISGCYLV